MNSYKIIKPFLFALPEECSHSLAMIALKYGVVPKIKAIESKLLNTKIWGINFPSCIGLAAGFDKNGYAISSLLNQGFGFIEVGTVTPKPQKGNQKPRLFRLEEDEAIINRMGFNNLGANNLVVNLKNRPEKGIVGVNIGKNKETKKAHEDYVYMLKHVYNYSDYIVINISSPNTQDLRTLQQKDHLRELLDYICHARIDLVTKYKKDVPLLIKIDPDADAEQRKDIANIAMEYRIDGFIVSNTTISRPLSLRSKAFYEKGGLSGKPLLEASNRALKEIYKFTEGKIPIIGVGGVSSAEDAYNKIRSGASLVQIYSSIIYNGFSIVQEIQKGLINLLEMDGFSSVKEAVGKDVKI